MNRAAIGGISALAVGALTLWALGGAALRREVSVPSPAPPSTARAAPEPLEDRLRLSDPADRRAFTEWFAFLAELQFFRDPGALPPEVSDCAALVRFAYREALRRHDGVWANQMRLEAIPALGSVAKYEYPRTPVKAALFRVREGESAEAFAEFADARTLMRYNAALVSRSVNAARPGDLLFFHQPGQPRFPFHVMIYLGEGRVRGDTGPLVVYHTGPDDTSKGEIRRPSLDELAAHPNPHWRPQPGNSSFLGVYRWNILNP